jgi:hypothetical protein
LVGKSEETKQFGRLVCRWKDNIKMGIEVTVFGFKLESNRLAEGPLADSCEDTKEHLGNFMGI